MKSCLKNRSPRKPGENYNYDNNNFYILRRLIQEISHYTYSNYVKRHVLKPMGIDSMETHFEHDRPACGYEDNADKRPGFPFNWDTTAWAGAAGWYGSVDDLINFLHGLRERTVLSDEATKILFAESMGFDRGDANSPYGKGDDWVWDEGDKWAGGVHSAILYGPHGVDAGLLINFKYQKYPLDVLVDAWTNSRKK